MNPRILLIVFLSVFLLAFIAFGGKLYTVKPVRFQYVSAQADGDWYWCKTEGSKLIWYWQPVNNITNRFYIKYTLLQTDKEKKSGISSEEIPVTIIAEKTLEICYYKCVEWDYYGQCIRRGRFCFSHGKETIKVAKSVLKMVNPFMPQENTDIKGTYTSYGYVEFYVPPSKIKYLRNYGFKVIVQWPPLSDRYYFAGSPNEPPVIIFER